MADGGYCDALRLAKQIVSYFNKRGVPLIIYSKDIQVNGKRYRFKVTYKKRTKIDSIRRYLRDAQLYLELALLQIEEEGTAIYIVASRKLPKKNGVVHNLKKQKYRMAMKEMEIAHFAGIDAMGNPIISDLTKYPHAMIVGTTRSGKSVALRSLLLSLIWVYTPKKVNILIGDGASDLQQFSGLPHLSYPVINDCETFFSVIFILKEEMERRISMKHTDEFTHLPSIIFIIDEFNSFVSGSTKDKRRLGLLTEAISELLRRGRHAKIHLILAAHNPTKQNMHIDMGDIPVKLIFRVPNVHNSVTVLGEGGAEKLRGEGDMYFFQNGEKRRLLGAYIGEGEISHILASVQLFYKNPLNRSQYASGNRFTITDDDIQAKRFDVEEDDRNLSMARDRRTQVDSLKQLFAQIILWSLGQESISCNMLSEKFHVGWRRANGLIGQLYDVGIVGELDAKLPRKVLPKCIEEVPEVVLDILVNNGISRDETSDAISNRRS